MQYLIFVCRDDDDPIMYTAPVASGDAAYLQRITAEFRPLSEEDYLNGPAVVLETAARYSYVLSGQELFGCVEWGPGLIVVRFSPNEELAWAAIRSPVPNFGGREADDAEWHDYDEDADNPQYNLVFVPWDAQFDAQKREWNSFVPADSDVRSRFRNAVARVDRLAEIAEQRFSGDRDAWFERCNRNLASWCGDGIRLT